MSNELKPFADTAATEMQRMFALSSNLVKQSNALKAENAELQYIVEQFGMWYNEDGCPKALNPDFPCSAEYEYKNDPETEGNFDGRDCWKEAHEHGCWVEYYRWKYRQFCVAQNGKCDTQKDLCCKSAKESEVNDD